MLIVQKDFVRSVCQMDKTNALRLLDKKKIEYQVFEVDLDGTHTAEEFADAIGKSYDVMYKTLVTISKSNKYYVFVLPANKELDLKKCAKAVGEKSVEMLKSKLLLETTGYIHGGCSPFNMKKFFPTTFCIDAKKHEKIIVNAGKVGMLIEIKVSDIEKAIRVNFADITME